MKKRLWKTKLGIPIWIIQGISLFMISSVLYDLMVGDVNNLRFMVLIGSSIVLVLATILNLTTISSIKKTFRKQFGA
jgi:hypothetical protein